MKLKPKTNVSKSLHPTACIIVTYIGARFPDCDFFYQIRKIYEYDNSGAYILLIF